MHGAAVFPALRCVADLYTAPPFVDAYEQLTDENLRRRKNLSCNYSLDSLPWC
ncbi:Uncharacterised protein [Vibrio cholerae]|nr:Uncharacterised protein [Vibrio cholerae]